VTATELDCERTIIAAAKILGYRVHGERTAWSRGKFSTPIKGDPGWPDLLIAGHGHLFAVELKRHPNKVTDEQEAWLDELQRAGIWSGVVWVPEGQQAFIDFLATQAQKRRTA
jgi:hypothetical protein